MRLNLHVSGRKNIWMFMKGIWWLLISGRSIMYADLTTEQTIQFLTDVVTDVVTDVADKEQE